MIRIELLYIYGLTLLGSFRVVGEDIVAHLEIIHSFIMERGQFGLALRNLGVQMRFHFTDLVQFCLENSPITSLLLFIFFV
jgi:hypothetical protein